MKYGMQDIDWEYIGAALANEGSDQQIKFFEAFVKEMNKWGTSLQVEKQLCFINLGLSSASRETLSMITYTTTAG